MNNADTPAMPVSHEEFARVYVRDHGVKPVGLTKREEFAKAAMQGLMADSAYLGSDKDMAACSVRVADALLAELEKTNER